MKKSAIRRHLPSAHKVHIDPIEISLGSNDFPRNRVSENLLAMVEKENGIRRFQIVPQSDYDIGNVRVLVLFYKKLTLKHNPQIYPHRSEERRVGKECRAWEM